MSQFNPLAFHLDDPSDIYWKVLANKRMMVSAVEEFRNTYDCYICYALDIVEEYQDNISLNLTESELWRDSFNSNLETSDAG